MSEFPEGVWGLHPSYHTDANPHEFTCGNDNVRSFSRCIAVGETTIAEVTAYEGGAGWPSIALDQVEPTARRIIACVNACNGLSTEDLEAGAVSLAFKRAFPDDPSLPTIGHPDLPTETINPEHTS